MRKITIIFAFLVFVLISCAPNYIMWNKTEFPPNKIHGTISELKIFDNRKNVRGIEFKTFEWVNKLDFNKTIAKSDTEAIFEEIKRNITDGEEEFKFKVQINEANVGFRNSGFIETWRGIFKIKIFISGPSGESYCMGESALTRSGGLFFKEKLVLEKLFEEGLILTSYKCLEAWKSDVKPEKPNRLKI